MAITEGEEAANSFLNVEPFDWPNCIYRSETEDLLQGGNKSSFLSHQMFKEKILPPRNV